MDTQTQNLLGALVAVLSILAYIEWRTLIEFAKSRINDNALCASVIRTYTDYYVAVIGQGKSARFARSQIRASLKHYGFTRTMQAALLNQIINDARLRIAAQ